MSQEKVEIVRQAPDAFDRDDLDAWLALRDPDYEGVPSGHWPEADAIRGREADWDSYVNYWVVVTLREGKVVRDEWFAHRAEALEAAGQLSE
jgi:ketosteroid isomerase-like protein